MGENLVFTLGTVSYLGPVSSGDKLSDAEFTDWRLNNFEPDVDVNIEDHSVVVKVKFDASLSDVAALEKSAIENLRYFAWPEQFDEYLLETNPYNIKDALTVFQKSKKADKFIDYFLSHSWEENERGIKRKIAALENFFKTAKDRILWFDQVCIDPSRATETNAVPFPKKDAIAALPITSSSCKHVLILFSDTYLNRIWCVWELYSVFAFAIKEHAAERIIIVNASSDVENLPYEKIEAWTIDDAHSFDPNDEGKLRRLVGMIGVDKFQECVTALRSCTKVYHPLKTK
jgi:hypothetical protein